jgi:hypothetical protein
MLSATELAFRDELRAWLEKHCPEKRDRPAGGKWPEGRHHERGSSTEIIASGDERG